MVRILFICHGNICRSPMAEYCFNDMVRKKGLSEEFRADSAAVSPEELDCPVYPPAKAQLALHGIDCRGKYAYLMRASDYYKYDMLICMEKGNINRVRSICGGDPEGKISLLLDYTDRPGDIADPWYYGNFEKTWDDIEKGCRGLIEYLISHR